MAQATRKIEAIDADMARLRGERAAVQAEIRAIAADLVGPGNKTARDEGATNGSALQPRQRELLTILRDNPEADFALICNTMYKRDDRRARISVSAAFSVLKRDGYVEALGPPGRFRLAQKGAAAIA